MRESTLLVMAGLLLLPDGSAAARKVKQPSSQRKDAKFTAYAYTSNELTFTGRKPIAGRTIAADPKLIPLGSKVRVSGAGEYSGLYVVEDTGGSIKGNKVDIFMRSRAEAIQFGKQQVTLTVLPPEAVDGSARSAMRPPIGLELRSCNTCVIHQPAAMIAKDDAAGLSGSTIHRVAEARSTGSDARQSNPGKNGSAPAFASFLIGKRPSSN